MASFIDWINSFYRKAGPDDDLLSSVPAAYRAMPSSPNIEDRGSNDLANALYVSKWKPRIWPDYRTYSASSLGGQEPPINPRMAYNPQNNSVILLDPNDPMLKAAPDLVGTYPRQIGYPASFPQNMRPPRHVPTPYAPSPTLPNMSPGWRPGGNPDLPYIDPHLPISPGDPGWAPPDSVGPGSSGRVSAMFYGAT